MNQPATLHRHLHLIRYLRPPYFYYSLQTLADRLQEAGFVASERTVERDLKDLRVEYGMEVLYSRTHRGYYLNLPTPDDRADFEAFVQLLERRERLSFLSDAVGRVQHISRYLQLETNAQFVGAEHLSPLWEALRSGRTVRFQYQPYSGSSVRERTIEPGLIFEYRNRWYLDGWDTEVDQMRTFGLDRMHDLTLTDQPVRADRSEQYRNYRQHAIGVTCPPNLEPERVVLRFTAQEGQYVKSLPLHPSQRTLRETADGVDVELTVIPNHELEREILAYGDEVEVLEPANLRKKVAGRVRVLSDLYFNLQE